MRAQLVWWAVLGGGLLCQTTLFPSFLPTLWTPDITRAAVLWVALTGSPRGGGALAFAAGGVLDAASGAPPGFGAILRLALYALARPFRGVFFETRPLLLLPFSALGAVADAVGAGLLSAVVFPRAFPTEVLVSTAWHQALVDSLWVPVVFLGLEVISGRRHAPEVPA